MKRKEIPNPPPPPTRQEIWNSLEGGEVTVSRTKYNLVSSAIIREWIYEIGVQPDAYMFQKGNRPDTVTIRFKNPEDLVFLKLSL
jgi:hypothetical protein|tara:strand:- start:1171 stop:1425 length:255 start_codon:yes stop_codon:yes gene_type:complete